MIMTCAAGGITPGSEGAAEPFTQQARYVEMCVRVMHAAVQQGLAASLPAWSQTVLQNVKLLCTQPRVEPER